ncbi:MAG: hypothetical protein RRX92_01295 [Lachnospiraceae bacterium]
MSWSIPSPKQGSITVEASLVLPLFLFAVVNLLSMLDILRLQSNMEATLHQIAKPMAVYAYAYDKMSPVEQPLLEGIGSAVLSTTYLKEKVIQEAGKSYIASSPISGGVKGISCLHSKIMQKDMIDIVADYKVHSAMPIMGLGQMKMANRCRMRAWTGYDNTNAGESGRLAESMVYVTESGSVYHSNRNCTHLTLSIQSASYHHIEKYRNQEGEKYHACESCGKETPGAVVYITGQGNRYHTSLHCSGIKRTVRLIPLSQVGGKGPCSRCIGGR